MRGCDAGWERWWGLWCPLFGGTGSRRIADLPEGMSGRARAPLLPVPLGRGSCNSAAAGKLCFNG